MSCSMGGCERRIHARDLCEMHYRRLTRRGDTRGADAEREQRRFTSSPVRRFFEGFTVQDDGCWRWEGALTSAGYGEIQADGRTMYVHRWVHEFFIGPIPDDLTVDHTCHNVSACVGGAGCPHRRCVNPLHLEAVTVGENNRRARDRSLT